MTYRNLQWQNLSNVGALEFNCGHCGYLVASSVGYFENNYDFARLRICPNCSLPSLFIPGSQIPGVAPGSTVAGVPDLVDKLYEEARRCVAADAPTASVLACRKLLMNIAVSQGAEAGKSFAFYVDYLASHGYVPPNGKAWVDHIRKKGNEANHEIPHMTASDARELLTFAEMLLKFIYEFPSRVPSATAPT